MGKPMFTMVTMMNWLKVNSSTFRLYFSTQLKQFRMTNQEKVWYSPFKGICCLDRTQRVERAHSGLRAGYECLCWFQTPPGQLSREWLGPTRFLSIQPMVDCSMMMVFIGGWWQFQSCFASVTVSSKTVFTWIQFGPYVGYLLVATWSFLA